MTDLERRALLGDRQAQEECTLHGVVLACPKCFKPVTVRGPEDWQPTFHDPDSGGDPYSFECKCGLVFSTYKYDFKAALSDWNTHPAPPIGRCMECEHLKDNDGVCLYCEVFNMTTPGPEAFCCRFEPKGGE